MEARRRSRFVIVTAILKTPIRNVRWFSRPILLPIIHVVENRSQCLNIRDHFVVTDIAIRVYLINMDMTFVLLNRSRFCRTVTLK